MGLPLAGYCLLVSALALPLALLPLPLAVLLVVGVIAVVLALIDPIWAVCWAILSVPIQEVVQLPGGLTVTQATLLLAASTWLLRVLASPERWVRWGPLGLPLAGLLTSLVLSTALTPYSPVEGIKETLRWAWVALVYLLVINSVSHRWQIALVVACLLVAPTAEALVGLWQFVTATGPPSFGIAGGRFMRAYGTIGQPNSFAGYMNMAWPLAAALAVRGGSGAGGAAARRYGALGTAVVLLAALGASFSRGGWVGGLGGMLALAAVWLLNRRAGRSTYEAQGRIIAGVAGGVALVLLVALLNSVGLLPASVASRLDSITSNLRIFDVRGVVVTPQNFAVVERMAHIQAGWGMVEAYPLLGVGPGNFTPAYPDFSIPPWVISQGHAHNYYLHIAAESGVVGGVAYLLLLVAVARLGLQAVHRASDHFCYLIALGGCGMMGAVAVHNLFENLHVLNLPLQLGAVWGLLAVVQAQASQTPNG